ncbi:MAG TPA: L-serine ammonia-lyase [Drouetiella sp.]|jgi:L-serine dehydratase
MNPTRADQIGPLDMFKIGIGPSSSHTVGPMVAALEFRKLALANLTGRSSTENLKLTVELFGSLSATGRGHATDGAVCAGLLGLHPKSAEVSAIWAAMPDLEKAPVIELGDGKAYFKPSEDILWQGWFLDDGPLPHPNTIRFRLWQGNDIVAEEIILSVGGGFVEPVDAETGLRRAPQSNEDLQEVPYPFNSAAEFVEQCNKNKIAPWQLVIANEAAKGMSESELRKNLSQILHTFEKCIEAGLSTEGILPGGLHVRRRAKALWEQMKAGKTPGWAGNDLRPSVFAMAVNEENAAGGRVVTAPTNGSSGLIPAVWKTLQESNNLSQETLQNGLMVASVVGALVKTHASISGAEVGCQGEVGTSCAMAAAGATAMLGGTPNQIENAAEIGIEHHLGMTCDPIMGLVQVPCIERNAMGAVKALNAMSLSLASDGQHLVSLDRALEVMKQTGLDMNQKYKETATGGLALG